MKIKTLKSFSKKSNRSKLNLNQLFKIVGGNRFEDDEVYQKKVDEIRSK